MDQQDVSLSSSQIENRSTAALPSLRRRCLVLSAAYVHVLVTAGVVFGWVALEPLYDDLSQVSRDRIFTVAASANYLSNLVFGPYLDRFGGVSCSFLACTLMLLGSLGMAAAELESVRDNGARETLVLASFGLLGFAGPGVQMPTLRCEIIFPKSASMVTSVNASLFDASCVVFLVFKFLHGWLPAVSVFSLFVAYAVLLLLCLITGQLLFGELDRAHALLCEKQPMIAADSEQGGQTPRTFREAVRSFQFLYLATFCAVGILRLNFVVMTVNAQLADIFRHEPGTSQALSAVFSTLLPMGGLAAPLTAVLLSRFRRWSYRVCLVLGLVYGISLAFESVWCQVLAYVIISVSRQLTYSIVFALTSSLFGQQHLGKLLAVNNVVVFSVGLLQYPIAQLEGSPVLPTWFATNIAMAALVLPLFLSNGGL